MIKNKHGKIELEILIFSYYSSSQWNNFRTDSGGILNVRPGMEQVSVLNAEFIPFTRKELWHQHFSILVLWMNSGCLIHRTLGSEKRLDLLLW